MAPPVPILALQGAAVTFGGRPLFEGVDLPWVEEEEPLLPRGGLPLPEPDPPKPDPADPNPDDRGGTDPVPPGDKQREDKPE